jgi:hypothetical protein
VTDGIHIPREVAEAEGVPQDLDAGVVGPYQFPDPRRRRLAAWIYFGLAIVLIGLAFSHPVAWAGAAIVTALGGWHLLAAWPLTLDPEEALDRAAAVLDYPVGHASAAVTFVGWRSRPRWHVVMYSADEPPSRRALVQFDGVTGERVGELYVEEIPPPEITVEDGRIPPSGATTEA